MRPAATNALVAFLRRPDIAPAASSATILAGLGISQPTLSRLAQAAGAQVVRIGKARATRYALARSIGRAGNHWPLYRIDASGAPQALGGLHALARGMWWWAPATVGRKLAFTHGDFASGLYPGWPWFLDDLRPQGFLGRAFARRLGHALGAPDDVRRWRDEDIVLALLQYGHDAPGDLVLGDDALRRAMADRASPPDAIAESARAATYPRLAEAALRGEPTGSSAAGEQPKFTAVLAAADGPWRPVIVKFSEAVGTPAAQRWADLLHCEHLAAETLRAAGMPAAKTQCLHSEGRTFLESTRFDRTPRLGRRGLVSLAALDAGYYGHGTRPWWRFAPELARDGWLGVAEARQLARLGWFGALIGNSDMHLGNVALHLADHRPLLLAPAYDMLPMRWRPAATGEVLAPDTDWRPPLPVPHETEDWLAAADMAVRFWQTVMNAANADVSAEFRSIAGDAAGRVQDAIGQIRGNRR